MRSRSHTKNISENFIRKFDDKAYRYIIFKYQHLSENFMREFIGRVSWDVLSFIQGLPENQLIFQKQKFIENFWEYLRKKNQWFVISTHKILNEFYCFILNSLFL